MMGVNVNTVVNDGLESHKACVRVSLERGLPSFKVLNFSGADSIRVRELVLTQFKRNKIKLPAMKIKIEVGNQKSVKDGTKYTLPIALAVLRAVQKRDNGIEYAYGKLSIKGELLETQGEYQYQSATDKLKAKIIHRKDSFSSKHTISNFNQLLTDNYTTTLISKPTSQILDLEQYFKPIQGQLHIKRALQIAIAGNHSIYITGSIGTGKSELIKAVQQAYTSKDSSRHNEYISAFGNKIYDLTITPETTKSSLTNQNGLIYKSDQTAIHFEEFPDMGNSLKMFAKHLLERQTISGVPIKPLLCFTGNLCPCGQTGGNSKNCMCTEYQKTSYKNKVPNNILNRIEMHVTTFNLDDKGLDTEKTYSSKIVNAREIQNKRYGNVSTFNSDLKINELEKYISISESQKQYLIKALYNLNLNRRDYSIVLKLGRTIADLDNSNKIKREHLVEALSYRPKFVS